jgi:hypothetical protein
MIQLEYITDQAVILAACDQVSRLLQSKKDYHLKQVAIAAKLNCGEMNGKPLTDEQRMITEGYLDHIAGQFPHSTNRPLSPDQKAKAHFAEFCGLLWFASEQLKVANREFQKTNEGKSLQIGSPEFDAAMAYQSLVRQTAILKAIAEAHLNGASKP